MRALRRRGAGFTLVELLVVIVVMGVLSSIAIPNLVQPTALNERAVTDRLQGLLRQARGLAMAQQRDVCVLVAPPQAQVVYLNAGACSAAAPVQDPAGNGPLVVPLPSTLALGGATQLRFNARGQPVPAASQTVTVGAQALTVHRETGAVL